ncbi:MAG: phosphoglycerate mutase (2,3-diphosphoglycerate-independent) [Candidatus Komeilibacteria bacterium RIFOXYC1_FULL_37_11]|uniref:2,3-bisphosphoglycerate-independent phosphoglycerate mutase n=1 Tax=Candidatus Komeilibacteria bacterium RIFOXYC1_FULL_37_11 TaxID=1798555 RepID=A0A1G2BZZ7_9BACT|nr:MAG: phosphoglycerate mutase (2,3-diphosphoglycerate-independent) [Candidatus Komeilibacteria bacterium RIFOXYC1_FULL_37_11]OGY95839.1 MAG: phosphoglycerate mutase (2,3-diphosphoglycerate-independent) [Candidatus Komeilibacteria bacterium RIFOXYD1_FULL_37_29]
MKRPRPVVLIILDGFGIAPPSRANAISLAKTPNFDKYSQNYPIMPIAASGEAVGLSWGEMGNSQVGHLSLGSGVIPYQNLPRLSKAIVDGEFYQNEAFLKACQNVKKGGGALHLIGLVSSGGIHSYNEHLYALIDLAHQQKITKVYVHAFLDGRDTPYNSGINFISKLQEKLKNVGVGTIASLSGRFWAMDRDNRWDRIEKAWRVMVDGQSDEKFEDPLVAIQKSYDKKVYDEEFNPTIITNDLGQPRGTIKDGDSVIFFNFRSDRARQLTQALTLPGFEKFKRAYFKNLFMVTMTQYEKDLPVAVAFPPLDIAMPLARVLSEAGLKQFHIAETEKYAHVTYFFNGGKETVYEGEDRVLVPSPQVTSYDQKPAMSARELASKINQAIKESQYDFIVVNFANPDMVGHTGNMQATIEAIEILDQLVGEIVDTILSYGGVALITADHGNAEKLYDLQSGEINKEHSNNPVPFFIVGDEYAGKSVLAGNIGTELSHVTPVGVLADVPPTILKIMGIKKPPEMTGSSLI